MKIRTLIMSILLVFLFSSSLLAGSSYPRRGYRERDVLGYSFRTMVANQTLNRHAGKNLTPVTGINGAAAEMVMDKYYSGFEKTGPAPTSIVNIGGLGGGGR